ncbi:MAG: anti-sigma factor family protein [Terriglobia bacterium]
MNCKRYKTWIIDSALGVSQKHNAAREAELRRHLEACAGCGEALERERRLLAAIDQTLERSLASEPSAHFESRLRQKIAEEAVRSNARFWRPFHAPQWAAIALACAVAIAAAVVWKNYRRPAQGPQSTKEEINVAAAAPTSAVRVEHSRGQRLPGRDSQAAEESQRSIQKRLTVAANAALPGARTILRARAEASRRAHRMKVPGEETPHVLVPKNEMALVLELVIGTRTGRINGESLLKVPPGFKRAPDGTLVPAPIEIKPIEIAKLDDEPSSARSGPASDGFPRARE